jgi:O-antigen/teichoic acid export membrane protein
MTKIISISKPLKVDQFIAHLRTPLYRNGYALMISTGITSALGLLYWALAARVYQTNDVGLNSMAISIMVFLSGVAQINLQEAMIRFIPRAGTGTQRLAIYAYGIVIALSLIVGIVFCLGISLWAPSLNFLITSPASILWFALALVLWGIFVLEDSILVGLRQALYIPFENAIFSVLKIGALLLLVTLLPHTGIFISWTLSVVLVIIPVNWLIFRRLIPRHVEATQHALVSVPLRDMAKYVAANYAAALLSSLASAVLPIMITQFAGADANAYFYLAWIIASSLQVIAANMSTSLTVEATMTTESLDAIRQRALTGIARILIPLVVLVVLGAPLILRIVGPDYVDQGTLLLQLLALSAIPNLFNMVYVGMARAQNQIGRIIGVYGANAVIVLGLAFVFLRTFGITGIGLAWVISQTLIMVALMALSRLRRTVNVPEEVSL